MNTVHRPMTEAEAQAALDAFKTAVADTRKHLERLIAEVDRIASQASLMTPADVIAATDDVHTIARNAPGSDPR